MIPAWFDTIALEIARKFTPIEDGQRRAQLQCAIVKAMSDAMAVGARDRLFAQDEAWNKGRQRGFEAGYDAAMAGMRRPE